jgi:hypothetical protein
MLAECRAGRAVPCNRRATPIFQQRNKFHPTISVGGRSCVPSSDAQWPFGERSSDRFHWRHEWEDKKQNADTAHGRAAEHGKYPSMKEVIRSVKCGRTETDSAESDGSRGEPPDPAGKGPRSEGPTEGFIKKTEVARG